MRCRVLRAHDSVKRLPFHLLQMNSSVSVYDAIVSYVRVVAISHHVHYHKNSTSFNILFCFLFLFRLHVKRKRENKTMKKRKRKRVTNIDRSRAAIIHTRTHHVFFFFFLVPSEERPTNKNGKEKKMMQTNVGAGHECCIQRADMNFYVCVNTQ